MLRLLSLNVFAAASLALPAHAAVSAYVANSLAGTVSVVDVRNGAHRATIPVGCDPRDIVAHPDGSRVYVANTCADDLDAAPGNVSVIDTATNTVVDTFAVPFGPVALAVDAVRQRLYAACLDEVPFSNQDEGGGPQGSFNVLDLVSGTPLDQRPLYLSPRDMALTRDGTRVFVSGISGYRDQDDVLHVAFSGVRNMDVDALHDGPTYLGAAGHLAIDPLGRTLYVTDSTTNELAIVDAATAAEVTRVPVGVAAQDVLFDKTRRHVFVTSAGDNPNALPDAVTAIGAKNNTLTATLDGGWAPVGMARVPRSGLLLVTNFYSGMLRVMRTRTGELLREIPVGLGADAVTVVR